jgi:dephospho-CoA kinase
VRLFGLTGGIASGKSAVAARFRARGVPVIDADELAREVVAPGTPGQAEVVRAFGPEVLRADGSLDRKAVARIVFADDEKRRALNAIVHPRITQLTLARSSELAQKGEPLACYEAALLIENGLADAFRPLVVVSASESVQIARTVARDGATEDEARARIRAQMPLEQKTRAADIVLENDGSLDALARAADDALDRVCRDVGIDPGRYARP